MGQADRQIRVLLVEDDVVLVRSWERAFRRRGVDVLVAMTLAEAVAIVTRMASTIDVVVLDLGLPDGKGEELLRYLDRLANPPDVVAVSWSTPRLQAEDYDYGIKVLSAPVEFQTLLAEIHRSRRERLDKLTARTAARANMSPRQAEILSLIVDGIEVKDMAVRLGVAPNTVTEQVGRLLEKAGCRNKGDLLRMVLFRAVGAPWKPTRARGDGP